MCVRRYILRQDWGPVCVRIYTDVCTDRPHGRLVCQYSTTTTAQHTQHTTPHHTTKTNNTTNSNTTHKKQKTPIDHNTTHNQPTKHTPINHKTPQNTDRKTTTPIQPQSTMKKHTTQKYTSGGYPRPARVALGGGAAAGGGGQPRAPLRALQG